MVQSEIVDGICVLRLNAPPLNTITLEVLAELRESIRQAGEDAAVQGVVITGDSAHFSAGADVHLFEQIASAEDAVRLCQVFQTAFQEIEDCAKPVVAAVTGRVIGGALELAMACHFRVAGSNSRFTMPEVKLGINPGAGGTQRLPRLVGPAAALRMLLTAETIDAQRALTWGLVDAVCPSEQVVSRARDLILASPSSRQTSRQTDKVQDPQVRHAAYHEAERLLSGARPEIIAPWKIVEAVKAGLEESYEAGLLKEQHVFDECMQSLSTQNKIYLFLATSQTSKIPELAGEKTTPLTQAAVVGMGSMGTDIAHALILAGVPVVVLDENDSALAKGTDKIRDAIQKRVAQGKLSGPQAEQTLGCPVHDDELGRCCSGGSGDRVGVRRHRCKAVRHPPSGVRLPGQHDPRIEYVDDPLGRVGRGNAVSAAADRHALFQSGSPHAFSGDCAARGHATGDSGDGDPVVQNTS